MTNPSYNLQNHNNNVHNLHPNNKIKISHIKLYKINIRDFARNRIIAISMNSFSNNRVVNHHGDKKWTRIDLKKNIKYHGNIWDKNEKVAPGSRKITHQNERLLLY